VTLPMRRGRLHRQHSTSRLVPWQETSGVAVTARSQAGRSGSRGSGRRYHRTRARRADDAFRSPLSWPRSGGGGDLRALRLGARRRLRRRRVFPITEEIRRVLGEYARLGVDAADLSDDDDLFRLGMTSHASVSVMLALEDAFGVEFPEHMLRKSTFERSALSGRPSRCCSRRPQATEVSLGRPVPVWFGPEESPLFGFSSCRTRRRAGDRSLPAARARVLELVLDVHPARNSPGATRFRRAQVRYRSTGDSFDRTATARANADRNRRRARRRLCRTTGSLTSGWWA